jgi:outer membrane protein OmpA-like peptidoglycan-associated protein
MNMMNYPYTSLRMQLSTLSLSLCLLTACQTPPPTPPVAPAPAPAPVAVYKGPTLSIEQSDRGVQVFLPSSVLFDSGKAELKLSEAGPYLDRVAQLLKTKSQKKISIEGHTDNAGAVATNQKLSEQRADSLLMALKERGVPSERMTTAGYAFNRPIASNANDEGRKLNRRVEVLILEETLANITQGEPANAFNSAWDQLRKMVEAGIVKPVESAK